MCTPENHDDTTASVRPLSTSSSSKHDNCIPTTEPDFRESYSGIKRNVIIIGSLAMVALLLHVRLEPVNREPKHCTDTCQTSDTNSRMHNGFMATRSAAFEVSFAIHSVGPAVEAPIIAQGPFPCVEGFSFKYPCHNLHVLSVVPVQLFGLAEDPVHDHDQLRDHYGPTDDLWGWVDPLTGREYALVSTYEGFVIIDVTDATHPIVLISLESQGKDMQA